MAHLQREPQRQPLQHARSDHHRERVDARPEVDLHAAERRATAGDAGGRGRRDVRHRRQRPVRARRRQRAADLELPEAAHAGAGGCGGAWREPRRGGRRRSRVHDHRPCAPHCRPPGHWRAPVGNGDGRLAPELQRHRCADGRRQPRRVGHRRRRRGRARLRRCLRSDDRQGGLAVLGRAHAWRAGSRDVEGQCHRSPGCRHVDDRQLRRRARHAVLGDRQSRARHDRRRPPGRQPLFGLGRGSRPGHRAG